MDKAPLPPSHRDGRATPAWRRDAAILVGIVRFGRIVQLIEEDRQVAVTPQRSVAVNTSFSSMNYCCFDDTTLTEIKIYTKYIYKQPFRGRRIARAGGLAGIDLA